MVIFLLVFPCNILKYIVGDFFYRRKIETLNIKNCDNMFTDPVQRVENKRGYATPHIFKSG